MPVLADAHISSLGYLCFDTFKKTPHQLNPLNPKKLEGYKVFFWWNWKQIKWIMHYSSLNLKMTIFILLLKPMS